MDEVTQQNAALVEEAAAAAGSLEDQASNLVQVVSVFKIIKAHGAANAPLQAMHRTPVLRNVPAVPVEATPRTVRRPAQNVSQLKQVGNAAVAVNDWEEF